jgi:PAS domain S-box-containing protein
MSLARILIVEDDRVVARDIQQQLARIGHTVVGMTANGEDALPLALAAKPDLVLMDVRLEGPLDGVDAAQLLRERCHVPVVFLTAYADDETVRRATLTEPFGYILKPFEDLQLRTVVEMALYKHRAEQRLRESERRYAVTLSSIGDAVIATDREGRVTFMNAVAETLTGWTHGGAPGQPLNQVFRVVNEFTRAIVDDPAAKVLRLGTVVGLANHTLLLSRNGREIPIDDSGSPIVDDSGEIAGVVLVFRDVTQRRQAEEADVLRQTNARLERAMQGSNIGVWEVDMRDGDVLSGPAYFANVWERLGYPKPAAPLTAQTYRDLVHPDDIAATALAVHAYLESNGATPFEIENRVRHADGSYRWMLARGTAVRDCAGQGMRFIGSVVDITELKLTEQALRDSEARFRGTFENAAVGIAHCMLDGRYLRVNQRYCDIIGYAREELLLMHAQDVTEPTCREGSIERLRQLLAGDTPCYREEKRLIANDGSTVWVSESVALQRDAEGKPVHTIAILEDISQRKALEATAREARDAAEAANRAKDQFLANISHELRTPLNGILGYAQILRRDATSSGRAMAGLNVIQQSGEHLLTLINDILDFSRIAAGKLELNVTDVALARFLSVIDEIVRVRAEQKRLFLTFSPASNLPGVIRIDERRLRQVLLNLLANAIKFTDEGEVSLRVAAVSGGRLRFEVRDTGVGVSSDRLDMIFQPFEQAGELTRRSGGAGLGLAISRQLIRMMDSEIHVASTVGSGSLFWFEIDAPTSDAGIAHTSLPRNVTGYEGSPRRVLVVDDVAENRTLIVDTLERIGFEVIESADGLDGLAQAHRHVPDLILMDTLLPGVRGIEVLMRLRQAPRTLHIPVIAVSADVSDRNASLNMAAGANMFLAKPLDLERLLVEIAALLGLRWTHQSPPLTSAHKSHVDFIVPSIVEVEELHRLALRGSMRDITQYADHLEGIDIAYQAFSGELRRLAENFESQALLRLIEYYLGRPT